MTAPPPGMALLEVARVGAALGARGTLTLLASRRGALIAVAAIALSAVAGFLERRATPSQAVDRALGSVFELVVPLSAFALSTLVIGRRRLQESGWAWARFGADRRFLAAGQMAAAAAAAALVSAIAAVVAVVAAHGPTSAPLALDAATTAWIAALTAAAYTGWFALGATFLRFGGGRVAVLVFDFLLGSVGLFAWMFPSGLAQNLLGLGASGLPQRGASAVLAVSAAITIGLAALRCGR